MLINSVCSFSNYNLFIDQTPNYKVDNNTVIVLMDFMRLQNVTKIHNKKIQKILITDRFQIVKAERH